jgi:hypothetical protein
VVVAAFAVVSIGVRTDCGDTEGATSTMLTCGAACKGATAEVCREREMLRSELFRASCCLRVALEEPPVLPSHDPGGVLAPDLTSLIVADGMKDALISRGATTVGGTTVGAGCDRGSDC